MAIIKIKGRADPIIVSNDIARKVKQMKFGDEENHIVKAQSSDLVDLGDQWSGEFSRIVEIELDKLKVYREEEKEPELTEIEKKEVVKTIKSIGKWLKNIV